MLMVGDMRLGGWMEGSEMIMGVVVGGGGGWVPGCALRDLFIS